MTEYQRVPTLPELVPKGLAVVAGRSPKGEPTHYRATAEGQELIYRLMAENAEHMRAHPEERAAQTRASIAYAKRAAAETKRSDKRSPLM